MLEILKDNAILYVEDEPNIQANIVEYLREFFGAVYTADDGAQAIASYEKYHPDVILLDINLPYIDGLSVAKEIRQDNKSVKIIMLTAHTEQEKLLTATELKLTKYLIKPITPKAFKETMQLLANELSQESKRFIPLSRECQWDKQEEILYLHGEVVTLTAKEYKLLSLLIDKQTELVCYEEIMISLWEDAWEREISLGSVKNQVSLLRKKLPSGCIDSIYGKGYRLK